MSTNTLRRVALVSIAVAGFTLAMGLAFLAGQRPVTAVQLEGERPSQSGEESPCIFEATKTVKPYNLTIGDRVTATLRAQFLCPNEGGWLNVALVLDASNPSEEATIKQIAHDIVDALQLGPEANAHVAVVSYDTLAKSECRLSNNADAVKSCIDELDMSGGDAAIDLGLREGVRDLVAGRALPPVLPGDQMREVLVLVSARENLVGCPPVLLAANQAKGQGILLATICAGSLCDELCIKPAASSPAFYYESDDYSDLLDRLGAFRDEVVAITIASLDIGEFLPDNMRLVTDSIVPPARWMGPDEKAIAWQIRSVPEAGITITYQMEPLDIGVQPTSVETFAEFSDTWGRDGDFLFPLGYVRAWPPLDSSPCRAETESRVSPETVDLGDEVGVELRARANCPSTGPQPEHTVLILDGSGSMAGESSDAMKAAAKSLISGIGLGDYPEAQLAVVSFNVEGTTHCRFTNDEAALLDCVDEVEAEYGSHWEEGVSQAWDEIARAYAEDPDAMTGTKLSMVLFGHGENSTGCPVVLEHIRPLTIGGGEMVTVCVGDDCPSSCLREAASKPEYYLTDDDPTALVDALKRVWNVVPSGLGIAGGEVVLDLAGNMQYVDSSAVPPPSTVDAGEGQLTWELSDAVADWNSYSLEVVPLEPGEHPVSDEAVFSITDSLGGTLSEPFPELSVRARWETAPALETRFAADRSLLRASEEASLVYTIDLPPDSAGIRVAGLELVLALPSGLEYVEGSASIRPDEVSPTPVWRLDDLTADGLELTLRVSAANDSILGGTMTAIATMSDSTEWTYEAAIELPEEAFSIILPMVLWGQVR